MKVHPFQSFGFNCQGVNLHPYIADLHGKGKTIPTRRDDFARVFGVKVKKAKISDDTFSLDFLRRAYLGAGGGVGDGASGSRHPAAPEPAAPPPEIFVTVLGSRRGVQQGDFDYPDGNIAVHKPSDVTMDVIELKSRMRRANRAFFRNAKIVLCKVRLG